MILPPKTLFVRLAIWSALFCWAVWRLGFGGDPQPADVPDEEPPPVAAPDTTLWAAADPAADPGAPAIADVAAVMAAMDAAEKAAAPCGASGTLSVRLGSRGLAEARFDGSGDRVCLTTAVRAQTWPAAQQIFELERPLPAR